MLALWYQREPTEGNRFRNSSREAEPARQQLIVLLRLAAGFELQGRTTTPHFVTGVSKPRGSKALGR